VAMGTYSSEQFGFVSETMGEDEGRQCRN
jgi:hypothetical protein